MDHAFSHTDSIPYQKQEMRSGMQKGMRTNMATVYRVQIISHMHLHSCKTQQSREQPGYCSLLKMFISSFMQNQMKLQNYEIYFGRKRGYPWHRTVNSTELSCYLRPGSILISYKPWLIKTQIQPSSQLKGLSIAIKIHLGTHKICLYVIHCCSNVCDQ